MNRAQLERNPKQAFVALAEKLSSSARARNPRAAVKVIDALARHGDRLPAAWRKLLVELADEEPFALSAAVGLAQVKPHRSMVPPMIRRISAKLDAFAAASDTDGRSWDDEIGLAVLAKCADARAVGVLRRLLEAPKVAHWDLMLAACHKSLASELALPLSRWLKRAKQQGVSSKWEGFTEGRAVLKALKR